MSKQKTKEEMFPLVEQWQRSQESQTVFCDRQDIEKSVFGYWLKKYREHLNNQEKVFTEIIPTVTTFFEVHYPNGVIVKLPDANLTLLKSLVNLS